MRLFLSRKYEVFGAVLMMMLQLKMSRYFFL